MFMDAPSSSQLVLGIDKRNPLFALYEDADREELHVYYGFELLEVVPNEPGSPAFKLLGGRLFNAGLKVKSLTEVFQVDRKTLQRWGRALQSGDAQELIRVLSGRSCGRKLTGGIEAFVRQSWPRITAQGTYGSSQRLCQEIQELFQVALSPETLRPLVRELKNGTGLMVSKDARQENPMPSESAAVAGWASPGVAAQKRETPCDCAGDEPEGNNPSNHLDTNDIHPNILHSNNPRESPVLLGMVPGQSVWCDHAGVLLFARALNQVSAVVEPHQPLLRQWSATLLLGALNIEQTKFLNWQDLELLLGTVVRFPAPQRDLLKSVATDETVEALFRFNARGLSHGSDLYFDPHTEHYTGQQHVLKGWCPGIRLADKALHSDFIHTQRGEPLYFETTDNFEDLETTFLRRPGPLPQGAQLARRAGAHGRGGSRHFWGRSVCESACGSGTAPDHLAEGLCRPGLGSQSGAGAIGHGTGTQRRRRFAQLPFRVSGSGLAKRSQAAPNHRASHQSARDAWCRWPSSPMIGLARQRK
jgi:hypothetical protein